MTYTYYKIAGVLLPASVFSSRGALVWTASNANNDSYAKGYMRLFDPRGTARNQIVTLELENPRRGSPTIPLGEIPEEVKWIASYAKSRIKGNSFLIYWNPLCIENWENTGFDAEFTWMPTYEREEQIPIEKFLQHWDRMEPLLSAIKDVLRSNKPSFETTYVFTGPGEQDKKTYEEFWNWKSEYVAELSKRKLISEKNGNFSESPEIGDVSDTVNNSLTTSNSSIPKRTRLTIENTTEMSEKRMKIEQTYSNFEEFPIYIPDNYSDSDIKTEYLNSQLENKRLQSENNELMCEIEQLRSQHDDFYKPLSAKNSIVKKLSKRIEVLETEKHNSLIGSSDTEIADLKSELLNVSEICKKLKIENEQFIARNQLLTERVEFLKSRNTSLIEDKDYALTEMRQLESRLDVYYDVENQKTEFQDAIKDMVSRIKFREDNIKRMEKEHGIVTEEYERLFAKLQAAVSEISDLKKVIAHFARKGQKISSINGEDKLE